MNHPSKLPVTKAPGSPQPVCCLADEDCSAPFQWGRFSTAKEVVAEHSEYMQHLKTDVFKVSFGSAGVKVLVTWKTEDDLPKGADDGRCEDVH